MLSSVWVYIQMFSLQFFFIILRQNFNYLKSLQILDRSYSEIHIKSNVAVLAVINMFLSRFGFKLGTKNKYQTFDWPKADMVFMQMVIGVDKECNGNY